jgi:hypothetical protein
MRERPSRIKAGPSGLEFEWDAMASKVQANLDQPGVPDPATLTSSAETHDRDLYLRARATPPAAIVEASGRVEAELRRRLFAIEVEAPKEGLGALAQLAQRNGLINEATQKSVAGLVTLRNLAVHAPGRVSAEEALEFVALAEATLYAIAAGHVERNLRAGVGNIRAADVEALVAGGHIDQLVEAAIAPDASPVKQRQVAMELVRLGRLDEAVRIGMVMENRAELRTVCKEIVRRIAAQPGDVSQEWEALERLGSRLGRPQRRDVLDEMRRLGVAPRMSWAAAQTDA